MLNKPLTENTRSSNKTKTPRTSTSGSSKIQLPTLLKYPILLPFVSAPIKDIYCYIIKHYKTEGLSVLVYRRPVEDQVVIMCGDWCGNKINIAGKNLSELGELANAFIKDKVMLLYNTMKLIKIEQAQFFFTIMNNELILVDIQTSLNSLASPGMVRDIFGNVFPTQKILKTEIIDERAIKYIEQGTGSYAGDLILKPSRFRMHSMTPSNYIPLYVEVVR